MKQVTLHGDGVCQVNQLPTRFVMLPSAEDGRSNFVSLLRHVNSLLLQFGKYVHLRTCILLADGLRRLRDRSALTGELTSANPSETSFSTLEAVPDKSLTVHAG